MRPFTRLAMPLFLLASLVGTAACANMVFDSASVVPTREPLPYSARVHVTDVGSYLVEPGSTLTTDPRLRNQVLDRGPLPLAGPDEWERAVRQYVATRQTFAKGLSKEKSDLDLRVRIFLFLDRSLSFDFDHVYVAKTEATVHDPSDGRMVAAFMGFGKAAWAGDKDDKEPVNRAVQASLNDLFGKIEAARELRL